MNAVVGASGCVGARLVRRLVHEGERVRALVRREGTALPAGAEVVRGDLLRPATLGPLLEGARIVYYLAHAMGEQPHGGDDLVREDRAQARNVVEAAREAGARPHVVFVSGLGAGPGARSAHLRGRHAVEEVVRDSGLPWTVFRAGVLLGPGSVGFEILLRYVRHAVLPLPPWTGIVMQPFALADLLDTLVRAPREQAFRDRTIELGTKDRPTYADYFLRTARAMGFSPTPLPVPSGAEAAVPLLVSLLGDVPYREAEALAESLVSEPFVVSDGGAAMRDVGIPERTIEEALRLALRDAVAERAALT